MLLPQLGMGTYAAITTNSHRKETKREKNGLRGHTHTTAWNFRTPTKCIRLHTEKQYECTVRVPKQCKHVQLIGDESLVISRSAHWLDRFFYRRQVCDARGICIKCVRIELHTHTPTFTHN